MLGRHLWHSSIAIAAVLAGCGDNLERQGADNLPPTLAAFALTTTEDTPVTAMIPATDADGDTLTFAFGTAAHGTVTGSGTNVTYTPAANYTGSDSFLVTASDGFGTVTAMVTVTISAVNDGPTATDDAFATPEDVALTLSFAQLVSNDTDPDGDTLTVTAVDGATNGTVTLHGNTNNVEFTSTADFNGVATFTYTVSDGTATDTATVTITVGGANDAPIVVNDAESTNEDVPLVVSAATLLANDSDPDGQTVTITGVDNPTHGTVELSGTTITFTPTANYFGPATFEYTASDGALSTTGSVAVTIEPVNDAPVAVNDSASTNEDAAVVIPAANLVANDTDVESSTLTVMSVANATNGSVSMNGTDITFTPAAGFNGNATFEYTVSDGDLTDIGMVTVAVGAVNDAPVVGNDEATTLEDTTLVIPHADLLADDSDSDGPQPIEINGVQNATNGAVFLTGSTITFTPAVNFAGTATFEYSVTDGALESIGTVTVTVQPVNDVPVAVNDAASVNEDATLTLDAATLLANDTDIELDTLSITGVSNAVNGSVGLNGTTITFTPTANYVGTASFDYTVSDGTDTDVGTVTVTVSPINDAPVANPDSASVNEDLPLTLMAGALLGNDTDTENDTLTISGVSNAVNGSVSLDAGVVTFTPTANYSGTASFDYTVSDGDGTDTATVTITVTAVPDAPVAAPDSMAMDEDQFMSVADSVLLGNDSDADGDTLTIVSVGSAVNGTVTLNGTAIEFEPTANFHGTASYQYTVSDGTSPSTATVTITVRSVNDAPVAGNDSVSVTAGEATTISAASLLTNDTDIDGPVALTITSISDANNGSVSLVSGNVVFTPSIPSGAASFRYTVSDSLDSSTATVTVTVASTCGNGVVQGAEECDDGGTVDGNGCSSTCTIEVGYQCSGSPSICTTICGDAQVVGDELCDDGGTSNGDGCNAICGVEPGYTCVGSPSVCTAGCGDGIVAGTEQCDDGGLTGGDGCSATCIEEPGYMCVGSPSVCVTVCGDGVITSDEECDDENDDDTDGCTNECIEGAICDTTTHPGGDRFAVDPFTGTCYVSYDDDQATFANAQAACVASGGYLTTITSAAEQAIVGSVQNPAQNPWIGAGEDSNDTDAIFKWVTGEVFGYSNFAPGQPDDDSASGGNGDCLHLVNAQGEWNDTSCTATTLVTGRICEFELTVCGDGFTEGLETCDDGNTVNGDGCSAVCKVEAILFSEYVEGSGTNRAIEIRSSFTSAKSLTGCSLLLYFNGSATASTSTINLGTQTIAPNDVLTVCSNTFSGAPAGACDVSSGALTFNGNDAVELRCGTTTLDVIGQIGQDPGTKWGTGSTSTVDATLRRKCSVATGDSIGGDAFDPSVQWTGFAIDTFAGLGVNECL